MSPSTMCPSDLAKTVVAAVADGALQVRPPSRVTAVPASVPSGHQPSLRAPMTLTPSFPLGGPGPSTNVSLIWRLVQALVSVLHARAAAVAASRTPAWSTPGNPSRWTSIVKQRDARNSGTPVFVFILTYPCDAPGATSSAAPAITQAPARRGVRRRRRRARTPIASAATINAAGPAPRDAPADPATEQPPPPPRGRTPPSAPGSTTGVSPQTAGGHSSIVTFCQQSSTHACCEQLRIAPLSAKRRRGVQVAPSSSDDASANPSALSSVAANSVVPRSPKPRGCIPDCHDVKVAPASRER